MAVDFPLKVIKPALVIAIIILEILLLIAFKYDHLSSIAQGVYIETWGTLFDLILVGIVLAIFSYSHGKEEDIKRYVEELDDFKKLDTIESNCRKAGLIRRLTRCGRTDIDFSGMELSNFSFSENDIESLKGAKFSLGLRFDRMSKNGTKLVNVGFNFIDCCEVVFSQSLNKVSGLGLIGVNLSFVNAKLNNASFEGAKLEWTDVVSDISDWYIDHGYDENDFPIVEQTYYPPFSEANLEKCSFRYAELKSADFRGANNVLLADFTGVKGLESCIFDDEIMGKIKEKYM